MSHISLQQSLLDAINVFQEEIRTLLDREKSKYGNTPYKDLTTEEKQKVSGQFESPMETLAHYLFFGGYLQIQSSHDDERITKRLYLSKVEFYLHECADSGIIKDFGMYHIPELAKNREKGTENYKFYSTPFPLGALHSHGSGIDITFDDEKDQFRASALIRGYTVDEKYDEHSTFVYDQLLMGASILGEGLSIKWVEHVARPIRRIGNGSRARLNEKEIVDFQQKDTGRKDTRKWQFYIIE